VRVLIVEDHPAMRLGIRTLVGLCEGAEVVGEAVRADEAMDRAQETGPDLVVLDLRLCGGDDGVELSRELKALPHPPHVLVYTAHNSTEYLYRCRLSGADSYVHKSEDTARLLQALERARRGEKVWMLGVEVEEAEIRVRRHSDRANLTPKEREVFSLLLRRRTNPEIACELGLSTLTVKSHVSRILRKLDLTSRREIC